MNLRWGMVIALDGPLDTLNGESEIACKPLTGPDWAFLVLYASFDRKISSDLSASHKTGQ